MEEGRKDADAAVQPGQTARRVGSIAPPDPGGLCPTLGPGSTTPGYDVNSLTTAGTKYPPRQGGQCGVAAGDCGDPPADADRMPEERGSDAALE